MIKPNQKGFTLLELLVVITLLAILSVGALVAYENIGDNASNVAAANNIKVADSAIRSFKALENRYPNQWDNLANFDGTTVSGAAELLAPATKAAFSQWRITDATDDLWVNVAAALTSVGISELQTLDSNAEFGPKAIPNLSFSESAPGVTNPADEIEFEDDGDAEYKGAGATAFSISTYLSGGSSLVAGSCTANGSNLARPLDGSTPVIGNKRLNLISDGLANNGCDLVLALGFGKDVPGSTLGSPVAFSTAPTYTNGIVVNPAVNYARYVALFQVAHDDNGNNVIEDDEVLPKPRLLAIVDTEGRIIDEALAGGFSKAAVND